MKNVFGSALTAFSLLAPIVAWAAGLNDLDFQKSAKIDAHVVTKLVDGGKVQAFYSIDHSYTNTLECEVSVTIPVTKAGSNSTRYVQLLLKNEFVFPLNSFPETKTNYYQIPFDSILTAGESIETAFDKIATEAAICHGFGPDKFLPAGTCQALVRNHAEMCQLSSGPGVQRYPLYRNDLFLGMCLCP